MTRPNVIKLHRRSKKDDLCSKYVCLNNKSQSIFDKCLLSSLIALNKLNTLAEQVSFHTVDCKHVNPLRAVGFCGAKNTQLKGRFVSQNETAWEHFIKKRVSY